jgi:hypothetical protein
VLGRADLSGARATACDLRGADLSAANFTGADLAGVDLRAAVLQEATLIDTDFHRANLNGATLDRAVCQATDFTEVNLSAVEGLETVHHLGPSEVSTSTIRRSSGRIPERFLRGCGFSDWQILTARLHRPDLTVEAIAEIQARLLDLRIRQGIQSAPLFISYGETDSEFVSCLAAILEKEGLRHWHDRHAVGEKPSERRLERIVSVHPTVLVVLSQHSLESGWIAREVIRGRTLGQKLRRDVMCPVAVDDAWRVFSRREPFRRWLEKCPVLELSDWHDRNVLASRLRGFVESQRLSTGTRRPDARSASSGRPRLSEPDSHRLLGPLG